MVFQLIFFGLVTFIVATILYYMIFWIVPWIYKVRFQIYKAVVPFSVVKPHWFWGHAPLYPGNNDEWLKLNLEWMSKSKDGAFAYILPFNPNLTLCHPDTVKKVLQSSAPKGFVPATGTGYIFIIPWLGRGLLTSEGQKWSRNRRLLTPSFHFDILKNYVKIYNECADILMSKLEEGSKTGGSVEIYSPLELCALNIILRCAFSSNEDVQRHGESLPYVKAVKEITKLIMDRVYHPEWYIHALYRLSQQGRKFYSLVEYTHNYAYKFIKQRKEQLKQGDDKAIHKVRDFLDTLLLARDEDGNGLTDAEINEEVSTFLFGGHDTTGTGLCWALYNLARHPHIQDRAREEVDDILNGKENKVITWDDLSKLNYVTRCIKESLRLIPSVTSSVRELTSPLKIGDHVLPVGTVTDLSFYCVHHNPDVWGEDHMTYDPDRFLPKNISKMDSYAYLPFSAGTRNCIGQNFAMNEMKTIVARILHKFELSVDTSHKVSMTIKLTLQPDNGVKLYLKDRFSQTE